MEEGGTMSDTLRLEDLVERDRDHDCDGYGSQKSA